MRIGIVGLGAIGGWVAARLALAGQTVSPLVRDSTLDALNAGLRIREADVDRIARIDASSEPSKLGPQDLLIIGVKAPALAEAAAQARPMTGENTLILPMLNGVPWWFTPGDPLRSVDPDGSIAAALPQDHVIG